MNTAGALQLSSGSSAGSAINFAANVFAIAAGATLFTPSLNMASSSVLQVSNGGLAVQGIGAGSALTVNMASGATLKATSSNVVFNGGSPGQISINANPPALPPPPPLPWQGKIAAGGISPTVTFNGGANPVNVVVNELDGAVQVTGVPYNVYAANGVSLSGSSSGSFLFNSPTAGSAHLNVMSSFGAMFNALTSGGGFSRLFSLLGYVPPTPAQSKTETPAPAELRPLNFSLPNFRVGGLSERVPTDTINWHFGMRQRNSAQLDNSELPAASGSNSDPKGTFLQGLLRFDEAGLNSPTSSGLTLENAGSRNTYIFKQGNLVLAPKNDIVVKIAGQELKIAAGAIVFLMGDEKSISILNLHDNHMKDVVFNSGEEKVNLPPGHEIVVMNEAVATGKSNSLPRVAYRNVLKTKSKQGTVFSAEFSLPSAVNNFTVLKESLSNPDTRSLAGKILKTAAAMYSVRPKDPFRAP